VERLHGGRGPFRRIDRCRGRAAAVIQYRMSSAYRSAPSSSARVALSRWPTGCRSNNATGTAKSASQAITLVAGRPWGGPTSTSLRIPRTVRVIGAQVTDVSTPRAASRVRTHTGRRPEGGSRSAHMMSPRATTPELFGQPIALQSRRRLGLEEVAGRRPATLGRPWRDQWPPERLLRPGEGVRSGSCLARWQLRRVASPSHHQVEPELLVGPSPYGTAYGCTWQRYRPRRGFRRSGSEASERWRLGVADPL
jgi:hypothetical protein